MRTIRVASVQMEHAPGDKRANLDKIRGFVERAAQQSVEVIAFPELCLTGNWQLRHLSETKLRELAEPVFDGPSSQELIALAKAHQMMIGAGLIEQAEDGTLYNTYAVVMPTGERYRHRKLHSFESPYIASGSEFTVFDTPYGWRFGVLICFDMNLIENVRLNRLQGAQVILAPHQTGGCRYKNEHIMGLVDCKLWDNRHEDPAAIETEFRGQKGRGWLLTWLPARAHDNGVFIIFSNGVGPDDDEIRTGNAMILDPYGRIMVETWKAGEDMIVADLNPDSLEENLGNMFVKTRRPELYGPLTERTGREQDVREARFDEGRA